MYLSHRDSGFPQLIDAKQYKCGVEVGVREGGYSERLLRDSNIETLFGVDIHIYQAAKVLETTYAPRYKLIQGRSVEVATLFDDNCFDFIHIDAGHSYKDVKADLNAWWPKLSSGGCFCGDDYIVLNNPQEGRYGVVEAVEEFVEKNKLKVYLTGLTVCTPEFRSMYATKQGLELTKKFLGLPNTFEQTPNWYLFKQ